ncbi:MAG: hypothetical protein E6J23_11090 [Chloroflexi bacterium]|nr:MAG: hypothetical protein E6J23_11090 [Chloroflexota bacterium]
MIVDLDADLEAARGNEHRRALALVFVLCLAVGGSLVGRDGPVATQPYSSASTQVLSLPPNTGQARLFTFPDRLANEAAPPLIVLPVRVRSTTGLAVEAARPGDGRIITWTEAGTVYWLSSDSRDIADLLQLADSLR